MIGIKNRDYTLGDEQISKSPSEYILELAAPLFEAQARLLGIDSYDYDDYFDALGLNEDEALTQAIAWVDANYAILLLSYSSHGCQCSLSSYPLRHWEDNADGFILVSLEDAKKEWHENTMERAIKCLEAEVREYSAWANGEVVGWIAEDEEGEEIDSCWGFYPDEKGDFDYAIDEAKSAIDCHLEAQHQLDIELCANI
jgi:hypothetical protein